MTVETDIAAAVRRAEAPSRHRRRGDRGGRRRADQRDPGIRAREGGLADLIARPQQQDRPVAALQPPCLGAGLARHRRRARPPPAGSAAPRARSPPPGAATTTISGAIAISGPARMLAITSSKRVSAATGSPRAPSATASANGRTSLSAAFAAVTSTATGSLSVATTAASGHSSAAAKARMPVPVPRSTMCRQCCPSTASASSIARQPAVVS